MRLAVVTVLLNTLSTTLDAKKACAKWIQGQLRSHLKINRRDWMCLEILVAFEVLILGHAGFEIPHSQRPKNFFFNHHSVQRLVIISWDDSV